MVVANPCDERRRKEAEPVRTWRSVSPCSPPLPSFMTESLPPSLPIAQVLSEHRSIQRYLRQFHPDDSSPHGISHACLDTFIRSCAGYCVTMYLLGVGDR